MRTDRARAYDAWYETPLGKAIDLSECKALFGLARPAPGETALDAGCGTGAYAARLAVRGLEVTGVDKDEAMLDAARLKVPGVTFAEGDIQALPFDDRSFDLVLCVTALCFVDDPLLAVREMVRVTRPGGRTVLGELNRRSLWAARRRLKGLWGSERWRKARFFTPGQLERLLKSAGAQGVVSGTAAYLPPAAPSWLISRADRVESVGQRLGGVGALTIARGDRGPRAARSGSRNAPHMEAMT